MLSNKIIKPRKLKKSHAARKQQLLDEIRKDIIRRMKEEHCSLFESALDAGDKSVASQIESIDLRLAGIRSEELEKIAVAEQKIQDGTYGICEYCGKAIGEERLTAVPFALYCLDCKKEYETT